MYFYRLVFEYDIEFLCFFLGNGVYIGLELRGC